MPRSHVHGGDREVRELLQHKDKVDVRGMGERRPCESRQLAIDVSDRLPILHKVLRIYYIQHGLVVGFALSGTKYLKRMPAALQLWVSTSTPVHTNLLFDIRPSVQFFCTRSTSTGGSSILSFSIATPLDLTTYAEASTNSLTGDREIVSNL